MWTCVKNKKIKTVVFDLNGTLTGRVSDHPEHLRYRNAYIEKKSALKNLHLLPNATTTALKACGLNPLEYYLQRNAELNWENFHRFNERVYSCLTTLRKADFNLVLYTDCHGIQVKKTLEILKLSALFDLCITEEFNMKKPTPKAFEFIAREFNCSTSEILMVGNDYLMDLLPLILIGGNGIQVDSENE
jgi:FMN phosphatase YigB (HAD superfamily)